MKTPTFIVTVKNGKPVWKSDYQKEMWGKWIAPMEGKQARLSIEIPSIKRSVAQNNYYWGVYLPLISEETGDDVLSLHEYFKRAFLGGEVGRVLDEDIKLYKSTTELTKGEFVEYLDQIFKKTEIPPPSTDFYQEAPLKK